MVTYQGSRSVTRLTIRKRAGFKDTTITLLTPYEDDYTSNTITHDGIDYRVTEIVQDTNTGMATIHGRLLYDLDEIRERVQQMVQGYRVPSTLTQGLWLVRWHNILTGAMRPASTLGFHDVLNESINEDSEPTLDQLLDICLNKGLQLHYEPENNFPAGFPRRSFARGWLGLVPIGYVSTTRPLASNTIYQNLRLDARFFEGLFSRQISFATPAPATHLDSREIHTGGTIAPTESLRDFPTRHEGVIALEGRRLRDMYLAVGSVEAEIPYDPAWEIHDGVTTTGLPYNNWYVREVHHRVGDTTTLFLNARPDFTLAELVQGSPEPFNTLDVRDFFGELPSAPILELRKTDDGQRDILFGGYFAFTVKPGLLGKPITKYDVVIKRQIGNELAEEFSVTVDEKDAIRRDMRGNPVLDSDGNTIPDDITIVYNDALQATTYRVEATAVNLNGKSRSPGILPIRTPASRSPRLQVTDIVPLPKAQQGAMSAFLLRDDYTDEQREVIAQTIGSYGEDFELTGDLGRTITFGALTTIAVTGGIATVVGVPLISGYLATAAVTGLTPLIGVPTFGIVSSVGLVKVALALGQRGIVSGIGVTATTLGPVIGISLTPIAATGVGAVILAGSLVASNAIFSPEEHGIIWLVTADGDGSPISDTLMVNIRNRDNAQDSWSDWGGLGLQTSIGVNGASIEVINTNTPETQKTWLLFDPIPTVPVTGHRQFRFAFSLQNGTTSPWLESRILNLDDFTRPWFNAVGVLLHEPTYLDM